MQDFVEAVARALGYTGVFPVAPPPPPLAADRRADSERHERMVAGVRAAECTARATPHSLSSHSLHGRPLTVCTVRAARALQVDAIADVIAHNAFLLSLQAAAAIITGPAAVDQMLSELGHAAGTADAVWCPSSSQNQSSSQAPTPSMSDAGVPLLSSTSGQSASQSHFPTGSATGSGISVVDCASGHTLANGTCVALLQCPCAHRCNVPSPKKTCYSR